MSGSVDVGCGHTYINLNITEFCILLGVYLKRSIILFNWSSNVDIMLIFLKNCIFVLIICLDHNKILYHSFLLAFYIKIIHKVLSEH